MRLAAITDEVDPVTETALRECEALDIGTVELRFVDGRQVVDLDEPHLRRLAAALDAGGFECAAIDTPFLKTPGRQADWDRLERGFAVAHRLGAGLVRVFSGLREEDPAGAGDWLAATLGEACDRASSAGLQLVLEVEFECNVATADEARAVLTALPVGALGLIWDPGNEARFLGATPDAGDVASLAGSISHVHVKDVDGDGTWVLVGTGITGWEEQLRALAAASYAGLLSIETHYTLPDGGLRAAARESVAALRQLAAQAGSVLA